MLSGLVAAACPSYPHRDFVWSDAYTAPIRPVDSLLDNCQALNLSNPAICNSIQSQNLSIEQKKQLILADFVKNNGFPPFQEANSWNDQINFSKFPPDNVTPRSSSYIKDAWVKITSIFPSVIDSTENKTYINDTGSVNVARSFSFVVPRQTFGDCRTDYYVCGYDYSLEVFDNGRSLNNRNGQVANFTAPERYHGAPNNFTAVLTVNSEYQINHYRMATHCGYGRACYSTCDYSSTEVRRDSVQVSDSKTGYYYYFGGFLNAFVDDFRNGLADGWVFIVSKEDFNDIKFTIDNSFVKVQSRQYQLSYSLPPYNVLTPVFLLNPNKIQSNGLSVLSEENKRLSGEELDDFIRVTQPQLYNWLNRIGINLTTYPAIFYGDKIHFLANANTTNCSVEINSHFNQQTLTNICTYNATQRPVINLTVVNASNSTFEASVRFYENSTNPPLIGKKIVFSYGSQNATVETDSSGFARTSFQYSPGVSVVYASFFTDFETKSAQSYVFVPLQWSNALTVFWYLFTFVLVVWFLFKILKKVLA